MSGKEEKKVGQEYGDVRQAINLEALERYIKGKHRGKSFR